MKYVTKKYMLNKGELIDDETMGQIKRRLSKTARAYFEKNNHIAIDIDDNVYVMFKNQILLNINRDVCSAAEYKGFELLVWHTKCAIKAYPCLWSLLHEVNPLQ